MKQEEFDETTRKSKAAAEISLAALRDVMTAVSKFNCSLETMKEWVSNTDAEAFWGRVLPEYISQQEAAIEEYIGRLILASMEDVAL